MPRDLPPLATPQPRITATHDAAGLTIRVEAVRLMPPDELLTFPFGLERAAARDVVRSGKLPAAKIGRRTYARRSDVLALVERAAPAKPEAAAEDAYACAVASARRRS